MTDVILQRTKDISSETYHELSDLVNQPIISGGDDTTDLTDEEIEELSKLAQRAAQIGRASCRERV